MGGHNKLYIASQMLLKAARDFEAATDELEYVNCILLAGAVINICYPIIEEKGGTSKFRQMADLATTIMEMRNGKPMDVKDRSNQIRRFLSFDLFAYNALKHAGDRAKGIKASDDIFFEADLKREAEQLICAAISDFGSVPHSSAAIRAFDPAVVDLVRSPWPPSVAPLP